jgi:hypothetical protein
MPLEELGKLKSPMTSGIEPFDLLAFGIVCQPIMLLGAPFGYVQIIVKASLK